MKVTLNIKDVIPGVKLPKYKVIAWDKSGNTSTGYLTKRDGFIVCNGNEIEEFYYIDTLYSVVKYAKLPELKEISK